jgi:hypothetical protein
MVMPHDREQVDAAMISLTDEMVLRYASTFEHCPFIIEIRKRRHIDAVDFLYQRPQFDFPGLVELIPVLEIMSGATVEDFDAGLFNSPCSDIRLGAKSVTSGKIIAIFWW